MIAADLKVGATTGILTSGGFIASVFATARGENAYCGMPGPGLFVPVLLLPLLFFVCGALTGSVVQARLKFGYLVAGALLSWVWFVLGTMLGGPGIPFGCGDYLWAQVAIVGIGSALCGGLAARAGAR